MSKLRDGGYLSTVRVKPELTVKTTNYRYLEWVVIIDYRPTYSIALEKER